ncbi:esterase family protein [Hoyosella sp. YIM 151337]|uniref:alpha/beta hydrolase n=1 Tax=Hoyosella sp. YIM 151337 TaxID=2992742 RepID=UPI002236506E|nr:alpha/beta hydrolase family protein [Hoyosella sp. YIM 151337]MCW4354625.1 esterase family protein [Hoyosella sp. YIM 151337]
MRFAKPRLSQKWRQRTVAAFVLGIMLPLIAGLTGGAVASAQPGGIERHNVYSAAMDRHIPVDIVRASRGGNAALFLLDGLRARDDLSGWRIETNAVDMFRDSNVNLVMPVGGRASFYADWYGPSTTNAQTFTYKWETFLAQELPNYLGTIGIRTTNNAVAGLSMAGSAALKLAADHGNRFTYAASFSGYLNLSAPGMPSLIRLALLDEGGYNVDDMWGPPWDPAWAAHDPTRFAERLQGKTLYISAGNGIPGVHTRINEPIDYFHTANAMGLEVVSLLNTRAFQGRADALGLNATYSYPPTGVHAWGYWQEELSNAKPGILRALGA